MMNQRLNSVNLYIRRDETLRKNMITTYGTGNPDATLYIKKGQSLSVKFEQFSLSPNIVQSKVHVNGQNYIAFIIESDGILFETFCSCLINGDDGEYYDCHHPDMTLLYFRR